MKKYNFLPLVKENAYNIWVKDNGLKDNKYAKKMFFQLLRKHKTTKKFPRVVQGNSDRDFLVKEGKKDYEINHGTYGGAIDEIGEYARKNGYTLDMDQITEDFLDAFFKPKKGKTKKDDLILYKNGKKQKKMLHTQIYARDDVFELNMYIN